MANELAARVRVIDSSGNTVRFGLRPRERVVCLPMHSREEIKLHYEKKGECVIEPGKPYVELHVDLLRSDTQGLAGLCDTPEGKALRFQRIVVDIQAQPGVEAFPPALLIARAEELVVACRGNYNPALSLALTETLRRHRQLAAMVLTVSGSIHASELSMLVRYPFPRLVVDASSVDGDPAADTPRISCPLELDLSRTSVSLRRMAGMLTECTKTQKLSLPAIDVPASQWNWTQGTVRELADVYSTLMHVFGSNSTLHRVRWLNWTRALDRQSAPTRLLYTVLLPLMCAMCAEPPPKVVEHCCTTDRFDDARVRAPSDTVVFAEEAPPPAAREPLRLRLPHETIGGSGMYPGLLGRALRQIVLNVQPVGSPPKRERWSQVMPAAVLRAIPLVWFAIRRMAVEPVHAKRIELASETLRLVCPSEYNEATLPDAPPMPDTFRGSVLRLPNGTEVRLIE